MRSTADKRAICYWLTLLAEHRQGLIARLIRSTGSPAELLELEIGDLRSLIRSTMSAKRKPSRANEAEAAPALVKGAAVTGAARASYETIFASEPQRLWRELRHPLGGALITMADDYYPASLRHLSDPPLCLFARSDGRHTEMLARLATLDRLPVVAIVGSRSPTAYGEEMARSLAGELARRGVMVISGAALGIDADAQSAALERWASSGPATVAVLGSGADVVYPRANAALLKPIRERGLLLSEYPWATPARAWRFPARNRLLAALAQAVVVVEGGPRSGSRLTADHALDLGREVLAVPGEAGRRLSATPHELIRLGAGLCESAADVLAVLDRQPAARGTSPGPPCGDEGVGLPGADQRATSAGSAIANAVLMALADGPGTPDEIASRQRLGVERVSAALIELEIDGSVAHEPGGRYRRRQNARRLV